MNTPLPTSQPGDPASPLYLLREARESRGVHIAALSVALKVPVKKLEALEAGRYDELPGLTFARALAASACRHLKVDAVSVLAQIPADAPHLGHASERLNTPFRPPSETATRAPAWLSRSALWLVLVLAAATCLLVFWPESTTTNGATPAVKVQEPAAQPLAATVPTTVVEPTVPLALPAAAGPVPVQPAAVSPAVVQQPAPVPSIPLVAEVSSAVPAGAKVMSIRATSESWVEVSNASGVVLLKRLLKGGEVVDFTAAPPYSVLLGRAEAAEVTVRGQRFDTAPFARNSVARFEVK